VPHVDRLNDQDAQILKLETGNVRGHTCKLVILEPRAGQAPLSVEELREHIAPRLDRAPRLRRRIVHSGLGIGNPAWVDDPEFDIAKHVRPVPASGPVDRTQLREIVGALMSERLDRSRPLWALDVVERLEDGSTALIWRIHHCMADGATAVKLASALLWDQEPHAQAPNPAPSKPQRRHRWRRLLPVLRRELGRKATPSPLDRRVGPHRRVAFASAPLDDLKRIGKAHGEGITVNDVVLAVVAGGVRAWLDRRHAPEEGIRVKVPVSLHHHDAEADEEGNRDSYFFVDLPVAEPDPVRRLLAINRETADRKRHHDAEALYHLGLNRAVASWAMSPHVFTFNVSNVPGPREPVSVMGRPLRELYSLAEVAQHHVLRVAVISAAGTVYFSMCADRDAVEDLDSIARGLKGSFEELMARTSE
jgi:diacylglycerol O-acyltransferase / wax synthase